MFDSILKLWGAIALRANCSIREFYFCLSSVIKPIHLFIPFFQQTPDDSLFKSFNNTSSDGKTSLVILKQPEKQHRARYHTEGSRGAVKDRGQNSFPTLQLRGYDPKKPAVLQVRTKLILECPVKNP